MGNRDYATCRFIGTSEYIGVRLALHDDTHFMAILMGAYQSDCFSGRSLACVAGRAASAKQEKHTEGKDFWHGSAFQWYR